MQWMTNHLLCSLKIYYNNRTMIYIVHTAWFAIALPVDCVRVVDTLIVTVEDENVDVSPVICRKYY